MVNKIRRDRNFKGIVFLTIVFIGGLYLFFDRPNVKSVNDLEVIKGNLNRISKEYNPFSKTKRDIDLLYYIHLDNYPCHFQVSYSSFDNETAYRNSQQGDTITLTIAKEDLVNLNQADANVRSFSLQVNNITYLQPVNGISGFGNGYFEISMFLISGVWLTYLIGKAISRRKPAQGL